VALTRINMNKNANNFTKYITGEASDPIKYPPKNKHTIKLLDIIIFPYSARKKKANVIDAYSTLYPETSSDSASGKSKGTRAVSANEHMKNITHSGQQPTQNHNICCAYIIHDILKLPAKNVITTIIVDVVNS